MAVKRSLREAFVEDHRVLIRGLSRLLTALEQNDVREAIEAAEEIDRAAGPHIEFEETVLYPRVAEVMGQEYADRLYHEHDEGLAVVKFLLQRRDTSPLSAESRRELIARTRTAADHAASCGALLSQLTTLSEEQQAAILERLEEIRKQGHRWTERAESGERRA